MGIVDIGHRGTPASPVSRRQHEARDAHDMREGLPARPQLLGQDHHRRIGMTLIAPSASSTTINAQQQPRQYAP